jgi:hypothetical protein
LPSSRKRRKKSLARLYNNASNVIDGGVLTCHPTGSSPTEPTERKEPEINNSSCSLGGLQSNHSSSHGMNNNSSSASATTGGGTKRRKMADLKAFVETRLLSRSHDKMLEKIDFKNSSTTTTTAAAAAHHNRTQQLLSAPETVRYPSFSLFFRLPLDPFVSSRNHPKKKKKENKFSSFFFLLLALVRSARGGKVSTQRQEDPPRQGAARHTAATVVGFGQLEGRQ